jgi:hypothetical protein
MISEWLTKARMVYGTEPAIARGRKVVGNTLMLANLRFTFRGVYVPFFIYLMGEELKRMSLDCLRESLVGE